MYNINTTRRQLLKLGVATSTTMGLAVAGKSRLFGEQSQVGSVRSHFPLLAERVNGNPLIYFDTAATAQRPVEVIQAIAQFYTRDNANPAPNLHSAAKRAFDAYENARSTVAAFINAADASEVIWTRGTTEAINLVAASWGQANVNRGDEILLTISEHASNMLPWQLLAQRKEAHIRYVKVLETGEIDLDSLRARLSDHTKIVCFSHVSNVLGIINPAEEICRLAHAAGAKVLIDAAQSAPHIALDVRRLGCDFLAFSSHKVMGPMGVGVLWARRAILDEMPPYQSGSNMAHGVSLEHWEYSEAARKFGAGTPNAAGAVGLAAALKFIKSVGFDQLRRQEQELTAKLVDVLSAQIGVRVLGAGEIQRRISLVSFVTDSVPPEALASRLDQHGIAIRAGDLAALPVLERFGVRRAARASLYLYNTVEEIDTFAHKLAKVMKDS